MGLFVKPVAWLRRHARAARLAFGLVLLAALAVWLAGPSVEVAYRSRRARDALARRDFDRAESHLARCLELWPEDAELHFLAARTARRSGALDRAEEHLQACERARWSPETTAVERAMLRAQQGDLSQVAGPLLARATEEDADSLLILEALAAGFLRAYQLDRLQLCLDRWLARDPGDFQALLWLGEMEERRNRVDQAEAAFRRALAAAPERTEPRLRLARLLVGAKRYRDAVEHLEHLFQERPGDPAVVLGLARCRDGLGAPREAARLLDDLLAAHPEEVAALVERGRLALLIGDLDRAGRCLGEAARLAPFDPDAAFQLSRFLERRGRRDEAARWREKFRQIERDLRQLRAAHGRVLLAPRDPAPRCEAGRILLRNRQDREGLRWLVSALQLEPLHREAHEALADYYRRQGNGPRAEQHERLARGEQPDEHVLPGLEPFLP